MSLHLAHRLPWESLSEVYRPRGAQGDSLPHRGHNLNTQKKKKLAQFARRFSDALKDFAATDHRPPVDEDGNSLDPSTWYEFEESYGYHVSIYSGLIRGYVQLNLLLLWGDTKVLTSIVKDDGIRVPRDILVFCDEYDGGHADYLAKRIEPILTEGHNYFRPLTTERRQLIRDHCTLLFHCLYSISRENKTFDPEYAVQHIRPHW